jgi:hypothetical protein
MIDADSADFAGRYGGVIRAVLVGRRILTAQAPGDRLGTAAGKRAAALRMAALATGREQQTLEIDAAPYGLSSAGILVNVPLSGGAMAVPTGKRPLSVADSTAALERSADRFIGVLFENQRIELPARTRVLGIAATARGAGRRATHALSRTDGHLRLSRLRFDGAGW